MRACTPEQRAAASTLAMVLIRSRPSARRPDRRWACHAYFFQIEQPDATTKHVGVLSACSRSLRNRIRWAGSPAGSRRALHVEAQLAFPNDTGDLSQPGASEYQDIGHSPVPIRYLRIRRSDSVPKEFSLRFSSSISVQVSQDYSKTERTSAQKTDHRPFAQVSAALYTPSSSEFIALQALPSSRLTSGSQPSRRVTLPR